MFQLRRRTDVHLARNPKLVSRREETKSNLETGFETIVKDFSNIDNKFGSYKFNVKIGKNRVCAKAKCSLSKKECQSPKGGRGE